MKKRTISEVFIALFLILSLIPSVGMFFQGQLKPSANETLAPAPGLTTAEGRLNQAVLKETTDYLADRFALRKQLVTAWARLNAGLLRTSAEEQVILGSDGWLYYTPSVDDYMGRAISDEEIERAVQNLARMQDYAEAQGLRFLFKVAPNKDSLYPEHMPLYIVSAHESSTLSRMQRYLEQYGIHYVDLYTAFEEAGGCYYYKTDSHWTNRGAALAADTLLRAAGKEERYFNATFNTGAVHRGDLYEMLYPTGKNWEESEDYAPGFSFRVSGDPRNGEALRILTHCESAEGRLFCWRDSFGISLYPYLAESFSDAQFSRSETYDFQAVARFGADTVILEIVERNLPRLTQMELVLPS